MAEPTDAELVDAARQGDREALEVLLRRHEARVHTLCRRLVPNHADALDAAQEALIAMVRGLPRFDGRSAFSTWMYRVTTNACLDELRRRGRRPLPSSGSTVLTGAPATGSVAGAATARVDVERALADLPDDFRAAVVLRDLCALDYAEIAEVLDVPAGTVRSRIARGRAQLARVLAEDGAPAGNQTRGPRRRNVEP